MNMIEDSKGLQIEFCDPKKYQRILEIGKESILDYFSKMDREEISLSSNDTDRYSSSKCLRLELGEDAIQMILNNSGRKNIPLWEKRLLTLEEASVLFGIGVNRLRKMSDNNDCPFVLWNQSKRLIKREQLEKYLDKAYSI